MPAPEDLATVSRPADARHPAAAAGWPSPQAAWVAIAALVFGLGWLFGEFRTRTGWDDTFYLLQVSSLVEDGDLDLRNDALHSTLAPRALQTFLTATLPSGTLKNTFSIGPAVLWLPAYAAGMPWRQGAGTPAAIRWSRSQLAALHLLSLAFLAGVAWFLYRLLETAGTHRGLALLTTLALLLGTPLAVYGPAAYTMAHLPSAVATSLLVASVLWLERDAQPLQALLAGVALGLVFLVRWQDAVFGLLLWIPLAPLLRGRRDLPRLAKLLAAIASGGLAMALLQLHVWHLELGSWLTMPQGGGYMRWSQPHLREFLLSGYSGLLPWSPLFALAAAGLLLPWRCRLSPRWRVVALVVLVVEVYINAAVRDWWGGDSFGARRMASCTPLLALGLANLAAVAAASRWRRPLTLVLAALCLWGCFTANLHWQHIRDLSLVVHGTPSIAASEAPSESAAVTDPALARRQAMRPSAMRLHNYFTGIDGVRRSLGILLTAAMMGGVVAACCLLLSRVRGGSVLQTVLLMLLAIALGCHWRLASGPRPDRAERAVWQQVAAPWGDPHRELAPIAAAAVSEADLLDAPAARQARAAPADAYRFLAMLASWEAEDPRRARSLLGRLAGRGYPAATELRQQVDALGPGTEVLRLVPGPFFAPLPGQAFRAVSVPPVATGAGRPWAWEATLALQLGDLEPGAVYDVAALQDQQRAELVRVSLQGAGVVLLATPRATVAARLGLAGRPLYQLRLRYDPHPGTASLDVTEGDRPRARLDATLASESAAPDRLLLGRNRQGHASFPLWSSTFSDLRLTAAMTQHLLEGAR
jgi:hypothetical protein